MKLDHPSYKEARNFFISNRSYFNTLSEFYAVHDKEYYEEVFLKIETEYSAGNKRSFCNTRNHFIMFIAGLLVSGYYFFPVDYKTENTGFKKDSFSIDLNVRDNSNFEMALYKFNKGRYTRAKEYLLKVESDDDNYEKAKELLNIIDSKIDIEGLTDTDIEINTYPVF
ncbi:MAG TPA: hypothetical protein PKC58_12445 [Ignavibacteria bacterium]|nr:hypothetical protein [Ignavibacteria bacterium]